MKRGVHLNSQTNSGKTAIHLAVANLYTDCVCLLIQGGCNLNIQVINFRIEFLKSCYSIDVITNSVVMERLRYIPPS